jgi:3'-5' exoribonuclease
MARSNSLLCRLSEMQPGQLGDFFALLSDRSKNVTRDGKPFYSCKFRNARRTVSAVFWSDSERFPECERDWQPGMFFKVRATFGEHKQYGPQIDIHNIRIVNEQDRADGFNEADLLDRSRFDSDEMFVELRTLVETSVADEKLRQLTHFLLDTHAAKIKVLPASTRHFHPFPGGWLEHTLSVTKKCLWLVDQYREHYADLQPALNRDLVITGAALHEIGRVAELEPGSNIGEPPEQTVPGRLFGHVMLGRDLVREAARHIPDLNPQLLQLLEHVVSSYLTIPEWGSPRLPMIPEVLILHHADDLDAKMEMYARCLRKDVSAGPFTERDPVLGKQLLKGREV